MSRASRARWRGNAEISRRAGGLARDLRDAEVRARAELLPRPALLRIVAAQGEHVYRFKPERLELGGRSIILRFNRPAGP